MIPSFVRQRSLSVALRRIGEQLMAGVGRC